MTNNPFTDPRTPSLAEVLAMIETDGSLSENRRAEICSAIRTLARWIGMPLKAVVAHPDFIRRHLLRLTPAAVGVRHKRFANVKSAVMFALRHLGLVGQQHYLAPLTPEWQAQRERLPDKYTWTSLSRLFHFCSANGITPNEVGNTVSDQLLEALTNESLVNKPREAHKNALRAWNRMVAAIEGWPGTILTVPSYTDHYTLEFDAFPASFSEDVESFLARQSSDDPLDLDAPPRQLRPRSIRTYRYELRRAASILVICGIEADAITSLEVLTDLAHVEIILRFLAEKRDGTPTTSASHLARLLAKIARHWVRADPAVVDKINRWAAKLAPKHDGLTPTNRARLAPLRDDATMARLLLLPGKIAKEVAKRGEPTRRDALLMQHAVALAILNVCPLRIGNLAELHLDHHLRWSGPNMTGKLVIDLDAVEVKNRQTLSHPLPDSVAGLVHLYVQRYRPLLAPAGSRHLFTGAQADRPKRSDTLSKQLTRLIHRSIGLEVNPHLYRHIVHLIVLEKFPGAYAMVSRILGHKSLQTAISNYAGEDIAIAMREYGKLVSGVSGGPGRGQAPSPADIVYGLNSTMVPHV